MTDKQDKIINLLEEISFWVKFIGKNELRVIFKENFSEQDLKLYKASDGEIGATALSKNLNIYHETISDLWEKWFKMGLMDRKAVRGGARYKGIFDLDDLGL
jgi:hypothetical protein